MKTGLATLEKQIVPIPAFYACYLLRSIARHSSLYVGSTPNPPRRLKQHNGDAKGGAVRTSKDSLRPWEMTCLVTGFPSKIAALQFEWAWQNPSLTRHIAAESRITQSKMTSRISPRTGKTRKRSARPRLSLTDRLANLHLLLRANSFSRWPLKLTFFADDVYRVWQKWTSQTLEKLRPGIQIAMDESMLNRSKAARSEGDLLPNKPVGIHALDIGYLPLKPQLEKTQPMFDREHSLKCKVCTKGTPSSGAATVVCTNNACSAVAHIQCLSSSFLESARDRTTMLPTQGSCPSCGTQLQWVDLVKELTLRMRGEKVLKATFKAKRGKKPMPEEELEPSSDEDDLLEMVLDDEYHELPESSDEDVPGAKIRSDPTPVRTFRDPTLMVPFLSPVITDSESDHSEVLL